MPLTKDDIDAVSITLLVNGNTAFMVYLTRGGLTQRLGSSERVEPGAIMVKGATDAFEPFLSTVPDALLQESAAIEDEGTAGPRHEWRFELGGGMSSIIYDIAYHAGSASLPDEFADLVVQAERLTHAWHQSAVAEETGTRPATRPVAVAPPPPKASGATRGATSSARAGGSRAASAQGPRGRSGQTVPAPRERLVLVGLLDFLSWMVPYSVLASLFGGGSGRSGPPGASLVTFAIIEFLLIFMVRWSPGSWLLGVSWLSGAKAVADTGWRTREKQQTLATGVVTYGLGVAGLSSWTLYHVPVPYFGITFPLWLSLTISVLGSAALMLAGALILRVDKRGVWLGGGLATLLLLTAVLAQGDWPSFLDTAVSLRSEYAGTPPAGGGLFASIQGVVPWLLILVPAALLLGLFATWAALNRPAAPTAKGPQSRS